MAGTEPEPTPSFEEACRYRAVTEQVGQLPASLIDEASGMTWDAESKSFFLINDSGDSARFFRVRLADLAKDKLAKVSEVQIENWKSFDLEDLSLGPCPSPLMGDCLALADIGDNRQRRKHVEIAFVPMKLLRERDVPKKVSVAKVSRLKYPDGAHNAEAFAVFDRDRAIIVTKNQERSSREAKPATVFEVNFAESRVKQVAQLDVPAWVTNKGLGGLVTGMSITPGARGMPLRIILLTYQNAVELEFQASTEPSSTTKVGNEQWKVRARRVLDLDYLEQQEAVAYDDKGRVFYTTEVPMKVFGANFAPIRMIEKVKCP